MIVELRDRFALLESQASETPVQGRNPQLIQDAVSALVNLGYRKGEVEKNVRDCAQAGNHSLEQVIKEVLRRMSR